MLALVAEGQTPKVECEDDNKGKVAESENIFWKKKSGMWKCNFFSVMIEIGFHSSHFTTGKPCRLNAINMPAAIS